MEHFFRWPLLGVQKRTPVRLAGRPRPELWGTLEKNVDLNRSPVSGELLFSLTPANQDVTLLLGVENR
jgi:hypothetical protein